MLIVSREALKQIALSVGTEDNPVLWWWAVNKAYSDFVCTCLRTHLMTKLNQKLTTRRRYLYKGKLLMYARNLGVGSRCLLKGGIFAMPLLMYSSLHTTARSALKRE